MSDIRVLYGGSFISPGGGARVAREIARALDAPMTMTHMAEPEFWTDVDTEVIAQDYFMEGVTGWMLKHAPNGTRQPLVSQRLKSVEWDEEILVSASNAAMWIVPRHDQRHINYCNTPPRWYYSEPRRSIPGWVKQTAPAVIDQHFATFVDQFVANSRYTQSRIERHYRQESTVVNPPVDTERFYTAESEGYAVMIGRLVPKKRPVRVAEAIDDLIIVGEGPLADECRQAGADVRTDIRDEELADIVAHAEFGVAMAHDEHFGITPKEFQAAGKPALVTSEPNLCHHVDDGIDGVVVDPTIGHIRQGGERIRASNWDPECIRDRNDHCSVASFEEKIRTVVRDAS